MTAVILLGLALGLDSLRASLGLGGLGSGAARSMRIALAFGICDGVAPLIGLTLGHATLAYVSLWSGIIGPILLVGAGAFVLLKRVDADESPPGVTWADLSLPFCLSLDNLVAGIGLGALEPPIFVSALTIGAISGTMSLVGLCLGGLGRRTMPAYVERLSGLILVAFGVAAAFD